MSHSQTQADALTARLVSVTARSPRDAGAGARHPFYAADHNGNVAEVAGPVLALDRNANGSDRVISLSVVAGRGRPDQSPPPRMLGGSESSVVRSRTASRYGATRG